MGWQSVVSRETDQGDRLNSSNMSGKPTPSLSGLLTASDINYDGAFRLPTGSFGTEYEDDLSNYATKCIIGMNNTSGTGMFVTCAGEANQRRVAEFSIPTLSTATDVSSLNLSSNVQNFADTIDDLPLNTPDAGTSGGQPYDDDQNGISIYGLYEKDNNLLFHYSRYYDNADGLSNVFLNETIGVNIDASDISSSGNIRGAFEWDVAQLCCGWISPIPSGHQAALGGDHIAGFSNGTSRGILSRHSIGPSAFAFDIDDIINPVPANGATIATVELMNFAYPNALGISDPTNIDNKLLEAGRYINNATEFNYGFIVPDTDTYLVIGYQAGYNSGLSYKLRNDTTQTDWGDYDAVDASDYRNYYMMFDVNDLIDAKNGVIQPEDILPYESGTFSPQFGGSPAAGIKKISGATFDPATGRLYMAIVYADDSQAGSGDLPVIEAYTFG